MGALGDILSGIKKVILLEENVGRLQRDLEILTQDVRRIRDYAAEIERRVIRIEGVMEGYQRAASAATRTPRIPKK